MGPLILLFMAALCFPSCSVVNHLDEALTLQDYSNERDGMEAMVRQRDAQFDWLLSRIASGDKLADLRDRAALLDRLGQPVLVAVLKQGGVKRERWLYRHQKPTLDMTKVYFLLNPDGRVNRWYKVGPTVPVEPSTNVPEKK